MEEISIGTYIEKSLMKVKGYNYDWTSMISSTPILFEDTNYLRIMHYVNNQITQEEIDAYNRGDLRKLYPNLELMLMDNIDYYDRIMSFCTMTYLGYITVDGKPSNKDIPKALAKVSFDITPTKIWCAAMCSTHSTLWELNYGWDIKGVKLNNSESPIRNNFHLLKKNKLFDLWISYRAFINNSKGFRETLMCDITPDPILHAVCKKFTQNSTVVGFDNLFEFDEYVNHQEENTAKLYNSLVRCMNVLYEQNNDVYAVYVFDDEFYLHTHNFAMRVYRKDNNISKDYISNSYECFVAEPYLKPSIKRQIEWCKYTTPQKFIHVREVLINLLDRLLNQNFRDVICIKRMNDSTQTVSSITFSGVFENVYAKEVFMHKHQVVKEYSKCFNKANMARYIIEKGYYIFGFKEDIDKLQKEIEEKPYAKISLLKAHYNRYCINIREYLKDIITSYRVYNSNIINYIINGCPQDRISTEIKVTNLKGLASRDVQKVIRTININLKKNAKTETRSYYDIISE